MSRMIVLSGVDETVPIRKLVKLQQRYPQVRYGVLFRDGATKPRYPSLDWIYKLHASGGRFDVHMCGNAVSRALDFKDMDDADAVARLAHRVQWNVGHIQTLTEAQAEHIDKITGKRPAIIQTGEWIGCFCAMERYRMLGPTHIFYDSSRGKGVLPSGYPSAASVSTEASGYGGGLHAGNLGTEIPKIALAGKHHQPDDMWIDAETGLRSFVRLDEGTVLDDFNIDKAEAFVENAILHGW